MGSVISVGSHLRVLYCFINDIRQTSDEIIAHIIRFKALIGQLAIIPVYFYNYTQIVDFMHFVKNVP